MPSRSGCYRFVIALLFPYIAAAGAQTAYRFENRTEVLNFDISGPGKAQSFYDQGTHIFHETDVQVPSLKLAGWNTYLGATVRFTDSRQYDPDNLSLQKLELKLSDANNRIDVGDYFANLSPYSMMKGIKGIGYQHNFGSEQNYVRAAYGSFDGQWAYLLRNTRPDEPMDRAGGGLRVQRGSDKLTYGVNLAQVSDRAGDPNRGNLTAYRQWLPAADWEYRDGRLLFSGEHAYSDTNIIPVGAADTSVSGSANRLNFRGAFREVSVESTLERVTPNFVSLGGGATPDRLRAFARADWRVTRDWRLFGSYDYFHNSLDNQLTTRTYNEMFEAGATRQRLFDRRSASLSVSARTRLLWSGDNSADNHSDRIRIKYKDRFFTDLDFGADYERLLNRDERAGTTSHLSNNLANINLGYRGMLNKDWTLRTNFDVGRSEVQNPTTGGFDATNTARINFVASHPNSTEVGMSYDVGNNRMTIANTSSQIDRAMIYWQRRPQLLQGGMVKLEASFNDYSFDTSTRNYRERLLRLVVNWNLERKPHQEMTR